MLWLTKQQLKSKSPAARLKAVEELCQKANSDHRALTALLEVQADADATIRRLVLTAIGNSDHERRRELIGRGLTDTDAGVRRVAVLAAKRLPDAELESLLVRLLDDADYGVRAAAAGVLEGYRWKPQDRNQELTYLIAKGQLMRAAAYGAAAVAPLVSILDHAPYSMRIAAVEALGRVDDPRILKPIIGALQSPEAGVCVAALDVISRLVTPDAWEGVAAVLRHPDARVRAMAAEALGKLGVAEAGAALRPLLEDANWEVRKAAAEALGLLRDPQAVAGLCAKLADGDADVREASAKSLGAVADRASIGALVRVLNDSTSSVRRIAAAALARIDEDWSSSPEAQAAFAELRTPSGEANPEFQSTANWLRDAPAAARPPLPPRPESSGPSAEDRALLAVSLFAAVICDFDRDLRQAAAEALGRLGGKRAEAALQRARQDPDAGVQHAAESSLRQLAAATGGAAPAP